MTRADRIRRDLKKAERVLKIVRSKWRRRVGVVDAGVGMKVTRQGATEQVAIHVYVKEKLEKAALRANQVFPKSVKGVPVDVIHVTGHRTRGGGIQSGQQIVRVKPTDPDDFDQLPFGTLGLVLRRLTDSDTWFLTCAHVAPFDTPMWRRAFPPGTSIGAVPPLNDNRIDRRLTSRLDWAAIRSAVGSVPTGVPNVPRPYGVGTPNFNDTVFRITSTGDKVMAKVVGLEVPFIIDGDDSVVAMILLVPVNGGPPFSTGGDSGTLIMRENGDGTDFLGIVFAGGTDPTTNLILSAACGLDEIDEELQIDFART